MATYERRCANCGKWTTVEILGSITHNDFGKCPFCKAPFGPVGLGDKLVKGDPIELVNPKTWKGTKPADEASKLPDPKPGEEGYRAPRPTR